MSSFGRKKRFIQEANRRSVLKGTVGMFGKWCKSQGLTKDGKVTLRCINKAKRSGNTTLIRRATFAKNIGGYAGAIHRRRPRFGKKSVKKTGPRKKYTSAGGRKSPGESATKFSVGTVKTGLDGKNWVIVKTATGFKRWKHMSSFGRTSRFGKFRFGAYADDYLQQIMIEEEKKILLPKIEKEIEIAEKFIEKYPKNDSLKRRAIKLLNNAKEKFVKIATIENGKRFISNTVSILEILTTLLLAMMGMKEAYSAIYGSSGTFRGLVLPLEKLFNLFRRKNDGVQNQFTEWVKYTDLQGNVFYVDPKNFNSQNGYRTRSRFPGGFPGGFSYEDDE
jgi:hypothetical protein